MFKILGQIMKSIFTPRKNVYRSKWGFHPCDYDTYIKLKKLRGYFYMALSRHRAWERWHRRLPKNKFAIEYIYDEKGRKKGYKKIAPIPEPVVCPVFSVKRMAKKFFDESGYHKEGIDIEVRVMGDWGVLDAYNKARVAVTNPDDVPSLELTADQIDSMLKEAEEWYVNYCS